MTDFFSMRSLVRYGLGVFCLLVLVGIAFSWFYVKTIGPRARERVIKALEERFDADVDLKAITVSFFPHPNVVGEELSIRHKQWSDLRPLIFIRRFRAATDFLTVLNQKNHINLVRLEGLAIRIPPGGKSIPSAPEQDTTRLRFMIDTIVADGTLLEIEPKHQGKLPLRFDIEKLVLRSVGPGKAMAFTAKLTNAKPPGLIDSTGSFGPWQKDDPRATAVSGTYSFRSANLAVFSGIRGILSSTGKYGGILQQIQVDGKTDTPDFALKRGGEPVHLTTTFHSVVDGIDGDTRLAPVDTQFLHSEFICQGAVSGEPGQQGKTVSLEAVTTQARMEDILWLITGSKAPILTGGVDFKSQILIPPGNRDMLNRLKLDGQFAIRSAQFASQKVQERIKALSDRARGISKKEEQEGQETSEVVPSNFRGRFTVDGGIASFTHLAFDVPGARITLTGDYNLESEQIDMTGIYQMQATLSQTQSGLKRWALKPFDPLFKKNGAGFQIPISITGTKEHPEIVTEVFHKHFTIH